MIFLTVGDCFLGWMIEVVFLGMDEGSVVNEEMERQR